jgi:pimeloyl-ACP methyl ester carboxylesterase
MGGNIALSFTLDYPERVNALILAGTNSGPVLERVANSGEGKVARLKRSQQIDTAMRYEKTIEANVTRPDLTGRLSEITKPALIMVGDRDKSTPRHFSEAMHRGIANSQMIVFPDCGHRCHEEQPDIFNSIVDDFLQRVEAA